MSEDSPRLAQAVAAIDVANGLDPHTIDVEGKREPAGLVYGRRMSATLGRISPQASEHLRIAVRGQPHRALDLAAQGPCGRSRRLFEMAQGPAGFPRPPPWRDHGGGRLRGGRHRPGSFARSGSSRMLRRRRWRMSPASYSSRTTSTISWPRPIPTSSPVSWPRPGTRCRRRDAMRHSSSRCRRRSLRSSSRASPGSAETAEPTKLKFTASAPGCYSAARRDEKITGSAP
jgi:hypothetical protein